MEFVFEVQQLLALTLHHLRHRDARPAANHLGDIVGSDLFAHHSVAALGTPQLLLDMVYVVLDALQATVAYLGHTAIIALALSLVGLKLQVLHLLLVLLDLVDQSLLGLPLSPVLALLLTQLGNLLVQFVERVVQIGSRIILGAAALAVLDLAAYCLALYLKLFQMAVYLVELLGHRVALHAQLGGSLVHQVYRLVGQEPVRDISLGELDGCDARIVLDTHLVVVLIALLQATQDADGIYLVGLVDHNRLETAFERLVLLKVLLILIERGGTDSPQFATCQGRLEDVGGIHGTFATAGTHERVDFVDEKDDVAVGLGDLLDDALESLLKLTLVLGTSHERAHVEREELLVLQVLRHVATHDTLGESLDDGGLARTRLTYQDRVVLGSARENLQHAAYFFISAYHRVELAVARLVYEVLRILGERLVVFVGLGIVDLLALSEGSDGLLYLVLGHASIAEYASCRVLGLHDSHEYGFDGHILVAHARSLGHSLLQYLVGGIGEVGFASLHLGQMGYLALDERFNLLWVDAQLLEDELGHILTLVHDTCQQVYRLYGLILRHLRLVDRALHGLLRLDSKFVKCHIACCFNYYLCYCHSS